jgi:hypothetical protein
MDITIAKLRTLGCHRMFSVTGVTFFATRRAGFCGLFFLILGIICAEAQQMDWGVGNIVQVGALYGLVLFLSNVLHSIGHVIAGRIVRCQGAGVLITAMFHINFHECDRRICSKWTHIARSSGGPLANLLVGVAVLLFFKKADNGWLMFVASANLIIGVLLLLPIPRIDGWVIWGELLGFRRRVSIK